MADKPEFVDMISEATQQLRRRSMPRIVDLPTAPKETSRLSHWPPEHWEQWRMETMTPWKIKPWKARIGIEQAAFLMPLKKTGARPGACFISADLTNSGYP